MPLIMADKTVTPPGAQQLELFVWLLTPEAKPRPRARRAMPLAASPSVAYVQLDIELRERSPQTPEEWAEAWASKPITRVTVPAAACPPPRTCAPRSVFDLAAAQVIAEAMASADFESDPPQLSIQDAVHLRITQDGGITRVVRMHHTETTEWQEREAARRARQKPPKAPKSAKTISRKLREMI